MTSTTVHPAFTHIRTVNIDTLKTRLEEYRHKDTGAIHYHFSTDNPENVFLVGLRTVPMDNKGVAHILEHTALCGSKNFPVRDPFFMMIRRSLNTFMNAFTSNDWTAYPFASQNKKDFNNLLDVYLDAVFFANLNELDFLQEGHRMEFSDPNDAESELTYKGVVYNEMKGAMSSINSTLWQTLCRYLFPSTTYHFNSGGDPEYITDLSYQELKAFYQAHYHPSNAIFMTYGDIDAGEHHAVFEEKALKHFKADQNIIKVDHEKRYQAPLRIQEAYAFDSEEDPQASTHLTMGWLLGQNTNLKDILKAQLLSYVLLENSASPLQQYLESTALGTAPSALGGLEDSYQELVFVCGLSGAKTEDAPQFFQEVMQVIQSVVDKGVPLERLQAIVHQLELSQREIGGSGYPYGLQIILTALPCITHRGDPIGLLDLQPVLDELRQEIEDPDFIKQLVQTLLIDNQHRVELVSVPDQSLAKRKLEAEKLKLATIKAGLTPKEQQAIISQAKSLNERQAQIDDPDILPKVTLSDIPNDIKILTGESSDSSLDLTFYKQGTNGLSYQQVIIPLPAFDESQLAALPLYCQCLTELGFQDKNYLDVQNLQSEVVGSIGAFTHIKADMVNEQEIQGYFVISAKALLRNQEAMSRLIKDTFTSVNFNEPARIKELISQIKERKEQSITGNGHVYALAAACQKMSPLANLNNQWSGILSIQNIKGLDDALKDNVELTKLLETFSSIHQAILSMPISILNINDQDNQSAIENTLSSLWRQQEKSEALLSLPGIRDQVKEAWIANTQVNFCAKAYATVPSEHPDCAPLTVLGGFLRNGYLHTAIREKGGAYGAGASQDSNIASFKFFSYRDPRLSETLQDFDRAVDWLINETHSQEALEEAILGVISSLDKPSSPAGEAKQAHYDTLFGRTADKRRAFRHAVLAVTIDDLKRVCRQYLTDKNASIGVVTSNTFKNEIIELGLTQRSI